MAEEERPSAASTAPPGSDPPPPSGPLDADATRGRHLGSLLSNPWIASIGTTLVIGAFVAGTSEADAGTGAIAAGAVALAILGIAFWVSDRRAREDFFASYAEARGLRRQKEGSLPPTTPLLRKGDKRFAREIMNGTLAGGLPGALALYTYQVETRDSDGDKQTTSYPFTVAMHDVPGAAPRLMDLHCERRSGFRFLDSAEDAFRRMKRLELESVRLDRRYEIFYGPSDDENWLRQLFSPSFIVWLAEQAPDGFAFEYSAGSLCIHVPGHHDSAAALDGLSEASAMVARRLAEEAAE